MSISYVSDALGTVSMHSNQTTSRADTPADVCFSIELAGGVDGNVTVNIEDKWLLNVWKAGVKMWRCNV